MNAEAFNSLHPVGTLVFAYPGARPEDVPSASRLVTRTRTEAQTVGLDRDGVVWVEGHGAYISLTHVDPVPADEWEKARTEEAVRELGALPMPIGRELTEVEQLQAQVAALLSERHDRNEWLEDAAKALRMNQTRITQLETAAVEARSALAALCHDLDDPGSNALGALYLLQQATPGTAMEPGETVPTAYLASHDSISMELYTTAAEARKHCESVMQREQSDADLDWYPEDELENAPELLYMVVAGEESDTGYRVTPLAISPAFDPDADE